MCPYDPKDVLIRELQNHILLEQSPHSFTEKTEAEKTKAFAQRHRASKCQSRTSSPGQLPMFCSADTENPYPRLCRGPDSSWRRLYARPHLETSAVSLETYVGRGPQPHWEMFSPKSELDTYCCRWLDPKVVRNRNACSFVREPEGCTGDGGGAVIQGFGHARRPKSSEGRE